MKNIVTLVVIVAALAVLACTFLRAQKPTKKVADAQVRTCIWPNVCAA